MKVSRKELDRMMAEADRIVEAAMKEDRKRVRAVLRKDDDFTKLYTGEESEVLPA